MKINIDFQPFSIVSYYSGDYNEYEFYSEGYNEYKFTICLIHDVNSESNKTELTWTNGQPINSQEIESKIILEFKNTITL